MERFDPGSAALVAGFGLASVVLAGAAGHAIVDRLSGGIPRKWKAFYALVLGYVLVALGSYGAATIHQLSRASAFVLLGACALVAVLRPRRDYWTGLFELLFRPREELEARWYGC